LVFVDHQATSFLGDDPHGNLQLLIAVAAQRPEHLASEALRMDAQERSALSEITQNKRESGFDPPRAVQDLALESQRSKQTPPGWHSGGDHLSNRADLYVGRHVIPRLCHDLATAACVSFPEILLR